MKLKLSVLLIGIACVLLGCSNNGQDDLLEYINTDLASLEEQENEILEAFDSATGENYTDDLILYDVINEDIVPNYSDFIKKLERVEVETKEVRDVHEILISAHNTQYNAMLKILAALDSQDSNLIVESNQLLDLGRKQMREYTSALKSLAEEQKIELTKK